MTQQRLQEEPKEPIQTKNISILILVISGIGIIIWTNYHFKIRNTSSMEE